MAPTTYTFKDKNKTKVILSEVTFIKKQLREGYVTNLHTAANVQDGTFTIKNQLKIEKRDGTTLYLDYFAPSEIDTDLFEFQRAMRPKRLV
jgi:hypothetical protein